MTNESNNNYNKESQGNLIESQIKISKVKLMDHN